jgi:8-amino-7-oxononanoate synthase
MDGDMAPLQEILAICTAHNATLIVDEAHATGVIGDKGEGLVQLLGLEKKCFARIHTFGKALGTHGAIVLGSQTLREYCINFCRPFIYTTALPESAIAAILESYRIFPTLISDRNQLNELVKYFQSASTRFEKLKSDTAIQVIIIPGNSLVKEVAGRLQEAGLDIRPILYPTVPAGSERLRIALHSFNTIAELGKLFALV